MKSSKWIERAAAAFIALLFSAAGCRAPTPVERGRAIYLSRCVVCHNQNPNLAGVKGPPIAGSSRELVKGRVLRLEYPPGYTPKRKTHAMKAMPDLARSVDDLAAYLQSVSEQNSTNH